MKIDIVILSNTKNDEFFKMTNDCIDSIQRSEDNFSFNIIIVESNKSNIYKYERKNVTTIIPEDEFNYNKFLNKGIAETRNDWVLLSNNDVIYHKGWLSEMIKCHQDDGDLLSMSPMEDSWHPNYLNNLTGKRVHYGYRVPVHITGWSIFLKRIVLDQIGEFDERFLFWYQDNDYSMNLQKHKIKHGLITNSKATHLESASHGLIKNKHLWTQGQGSVFFEKWAPYIRSGLYVH
jgi:GT2 family glycosyltransferase